MSISAQLYVYAVSQLLESDFVTDEEFANKCKQIAERSRLAAKIFKESRHDAEE